MYIWNASTVLREQVFECLDERLIQSSKKGMSVHMPWNLKLRPKLVMQLKSLSRAVAIHVIHGKVFKSDGISLFVECLQIFGDLSQVSLSAGSWQFYVLTVTHLNFLKSLAKVLLWKENCYCVSTSHVWMKNTTRVQQSAVVYDSSCVNKVEKFSVLLVCIENCLKSLSMVAEKGFPLAIKKTKIVLLHPVLSLYVADLS